MLLALSLPAPISPAPSRPTRRADGHCHRHVVELSAPRHTIARARRHPSRERDAKLTCARAIKLRSGKVVVEPTRIVRPGRGARQVSRAATPALSTALARITEVLARARAAWCDHRSSRRWSECEVGLRMAWRRGARDCAPACNLALTLRLRDRRIVASIQNYGNIEAANHGASQVAGQPPASRDHVGPLADADVEFPAALPRRVADVRSTIGRLRARSNARRTRSPRPSVAVLVSDPTVSPAG